MPTFDTPEPISVTVVLGAGDLRIVAGERMNTVVEVRPSDPARPADAKAAAETRVEYANGALHIRAPKGWKRHSLRGARESVEIRIDLPTGSQLRGEAGLVPLLVSGTLDNCRYRTGAGDITVEHVRGVAELTTAIGAVRIDRVDSAAMIRNANGDTWIGEAGGDVQVQAANGAIAVDHARAAVSARSANGDIHLDEVARGVVVAETARGNVDAAVRPGVAAWLDLHTGLGRVRNLLDTGGPPGPSEDTVEVRARSAFGDITVRRGADHPGT